MRFAVRAATLATAIALAGAGQPADPLAAIAAANGHAALVHVHAVASRVDEGRTVTTSFDQLGTARLLERCVAGVCGGVWFDGERRWTFGANEVALPEADDGETLAERTLAAIASYAFAEPPFRAGGGSVVASSANRWRVRARGGAELVAVLDPATHAVRRVETAAGAVVAEYGRDVRVAGATFALARAGPLEAGVLDGATAASGGLGPPAGPAVTFAGDGRLALGTEPVPIVACSLGGRSERCLLDTGATPSAVTLAVAESLKLEPQGELEVSGFGRFATGLVETGPLVLGSARFARARFAVIPATAGLRFDVVVGSDLLGRVRLSLDRAHATARVAAPGGSSGDGTSVPLTFLAGSPELPAVFGTEGHRALLDTGDASIVSFGIADYRLGPQWPVVGRGQAVGVAGADDTLLVQLPSLAVGALSAGPVAATVRRTQAVPHVGIGLWTRFRIDIDEASGRISFSSS